MTGVQTCALPISNRKYPLAEILDACRRFPLKKRSRITFEYVLLEGVNDTPEDARRLAKLLSGIRADLINPDGEGTDIAPMMDEGVTGASLDVDGTHYFDIHHTQADTFDKVNPHELAACVAALAVMAYVVADMPERL